MAQHLFGNLKQVRQKSRRFFAMYRQSEHHAALNEQSPAHVRAQGSGRQLAVDFTLAPTKLPLYAGCLHFLRRVRADKTVSVLNVAWPVPTTRLDDGVWVTLALTPGDATLAIYD